MTKRFISCIIFFLSIQISIFSQQQNRGTLSIKYIGVHNEIGYMAIGINLTPEGWPNTADTIVNWPKKNIKDGVFIGKIINLPYGTYAISVLDDENNNAEMDRTLGMPREGYGFSNNPVVKL